MPRRAQRPDKGQKGHDHKRPRKFHRGPSQGRKDEKHMEAKVRPAYARADDDRAEVAAIVSRHRGEVADWQKLLDGLSHVAPFVPKWEATPWP